MHKSWLSLVLLLSLALSTCAPAGTEMVISTADITQLPIASATLPPATETPLPTLTSTAQPSPTPIPSTDTPVPEPIRIGFLAPLNFPNPVLSLSPKEGVELAVEEWNTRGGLSGRPIELVSMDTGCRPELAIEAFSKLVEEEGIRYLIGDQCSSTTMVLSALAAEKEVILITPGATNPAVTKSENGEVWPFTFRTCTADPYQGTMMAKFAVEQGYQTAFLLYDAKDPYGLRLSFAFRDKFAELGGEVLGEEFYKTDDNDYSMQLDKIKRSGAEVLYVPGYDADVSRVGQQAREAGIDIVMMGGDGWGENNLDLEAVEGGFYTIHHDPDDPRKIVQDWNARYGERYTDEQGQPKVPDMVAALAYDAANLLFQAIDETGVDDPVLVRDTIAMGSWKMVTGTTRFDKFHDPIKLLTVIGIVDGKRVFIGTVEP